MQQEFKTGPISYLLHLPTNLDSQEKWPLILFLHGSGERGTDLSKVKVIGLANKIDTEPDFPFIVISPQCALDTRWQDHLDELTTLLDEIIANYPVDTQRVYLTGLSMGGQGTWSMAIHEPDRFAAIAPICGRRPPADDLAAEVQKIKHLPIWVFHGEKDDVVPVEESRIMVDLLEKAGADVRFTPYPDDDHNSWDSAYGEEDLYPWFLSHATSG